VGCRTKTAIFCDFYKVKKINTMILKGF